MPYVIERDGKYWGGSAHLVDWGELEAAYVFQARPKKDEPIIRAFAPVARVVEVAISIVEPPKIVRPTVGLLNYEDNASWREIWVRGMVGHTTRFPLPKKPDSNLCFKCNHGAGFHDGDNGCMWHGCSCIEFWTRTKEPRKPNDDDDICAKCGSSRWWHDHTEAHCGSFTPAEAAQ